MYWLKSTRNNENSHNQLIYAKSLVLSLFSCVVVFISYLVLLSLICAGILDNIDPKKYDVQL